MSEGYRCLNLGPKTNMFSITKPILPHLNLMIWAYASIQEIELKCLRQNDRTRLDLMTAARMDQTD